MALPNTVIKRNPATNTTTGFSPQTGVSTVQNGKPVAPQSPGMFSTQPPASPSMAPQRARDATQPASLNPAPAQDPNYGWGNAKGRSEMFYDQRDWSQPGQAQQYWNANSGNFNGQANLDSYYDSAMKRGTEQLGNKFRASGMFGSSGNQDAMADFGTGLMAEKANREADFNLQSTRAGFDSALGLDANARAGDYFRAQAGATADNAFRNRENDKYNQIMGLLGTAGGMYSGGMGDAFAADQNAFDSANNAGAASAAATTARSQQEGQDFMQMAGTGAKLYSQFYTPQQTPAPLPPGRGGYGDGYMTPGW